MQVVFLALLATYAEKEGANNVPDPIFFNVSCDMDTVQIPTTAVRTNPHYCT